MTYSISGFNLNTTSPPTQLSFIKPSTLDLSARKLRSFQVRCKGDSEREAPKRLFLSRRDAMICLTTLSSAVVGVSSPGVAEARIKRDEIRRKFREKVEILKEKAGLSKQKDNDKEESPPASTKKENNLTLEPPPLPLPNLPQRLGRSVVEASYNQ